MKLSYDYNGSLEMPKMFLANPQKSYIGTIVGVEHLVITEKFNNINEISFDIYKNVNGEETPHYDKIVEKRLIEVQFIGWFQILNIEEKHDENSKEGYKTVTCYSLENELVGKRASDLNGVFALCDYSDVSKSILHICTADTGWKIGHIDNELLSKYRTFNQDSVQIYNFLMQDCSKSFECVFTFDTYEKSINAYLLSNIGELTDIVISRKNILKEYIKESSADKIITKLKIKGADGVDIRAINPTGTNYLINLDYFLNTDWMSQSTIDAWNEYKAKQENYNVQYTWLLNVLKSHQTQLTTLKTELKDLNSQKSAQDNIVGASIELHGRAPIYTDSDYSSYRNAIALSSTYLTQIKAKESEIANKEQQIATTRSLLDNIGVDLDITSNFTNEQIAEINCFITENEEYQDSTFNQTSEMTDEEVTEMKLELMQNGANELARASQPQYTISINANNLYTICDDKDTVVSYREIRDQLQIGNLITIKFRDDYSTTARLMEIKLDFDNPESFDLLFSDKSRLDDEFIQLSEIIANAGRTSTTLSLKQYGYDQAKDIANPVREFMSGSLNASTNAIVNNDNQDTLIDNYGIRMRKWLPNQNRYDHKQAWFNNNILLFTDDSWMSSKAGIGNFTAPTGETYYGVLADVICGNLVMGNALNITNTSGTYSITNNGLQCMNGIYSVTINPNTPAQIFNIAVNGISKLYVDTTNNQLVMDGHINANSGTLGNLTVLGTLTGGTFSGSNFVGATGTFSGTVSAGYITGSTISGGNISGSSISSGTISGSKIYGTTINSDWEHGDSKITLYMDQTDFAVEYRSVNTLINRSAMGQYGVYITNKEYGNNYYGSYKANSIQLRNGNTYYFQVDQSLFQYKGYDIVTTNNASSLSVNNSRYLGGMVYVSSGDNLISTNSTSCVGSAIHPWNAVYAINEWGSISDRNKKNTICELDDRYIQFAEKLLDMPRSFKMNSGISTSGRTHIGFIAQDIEKIMLDCGISDLEFAGLVKEPIYQSTLPNGEYDKDSPIIDYVYYLRYSEFIPLLCAKVKILSEEIEKLRK